MSFQVKILGSSSAIPTNNRNHSAQIVTFYDKLFLIDCGESTQIQLRKYKVKINKINAIFISHLHGDHFLGLFGLLSSMSLLGRTKDLELYGPRGIDEIILTQLKYSASVLNFTIKFKTLEQTSALTPVVSYGNMRISAFPLQHRITCNGFLFEETSRPRKIIIDKIKPEDVSKTRMRMLKQGMDVKSVDGEVLYRSEDVTLPPPPNRKYAYCSDTKYDESLIQYIGGCSLLYHEATFLEDHKQRAAETYHCTAREAAAIAHKAKVNQMIIGHFSGRYHDLEPFLDEAKPLFPATDLALEGKEFKVGLP